MKPRNKYEQEVEMLRSTFDSIEKWECNLDWIEKNHTKGMNEYFAIFERVGDWQVILMVMYRSWSKKREALHEPLRYWIHRDGNSVIECKNRQFMGNYYIDAWVLDSEMAIRQAGNNRDLRRLCANHIKVRSLIPELKRTGFRANGRMEKNLMPFWLVHSLLTNNRVETLFKLRQTWLTWKFYHFDTAKLTENVWQSIRVALRHGYHWDSQQEINDWLDMIADLEYLGLDTRNPHYICPKNLLDAHQHWMVKAHIKRNADKFTEELKEAEAYEPTFKATREQFFGMVFQSGNISITIIPTAKAIKEEGLAMHHCVGRYYDRPESLILSAKVDGKRMETIEVDLRDYHIVQIRGCCNKETSFHKRIENLMEKGLPEIIKRNEQHNMKIAV